MAEESRIVCQIEVREGTVKVITNRPGKNPTTPEVGAFEHAKALSDLADKQADPLAYGRELFESVFADPKVFGAFYLADKDAGDFSVQFQVLVPTKLASLLSLRWEYLSDRTEPNPRRLAVEKPFQIVRQLQDVAVQELEPLKERPRVLAVISNPKNLATYATPEGLTFDPIEHPLSRSETIALDRLFDELKKQAKIADYQILGVNLADHPPGYPTQSAILSLLKEASDAGKPYHIIHFLAHGYYREEEAKGYLLLTDNSGAAKPVPQERLRDLFPSNHQIRLVFFAACQSAEQAVKQPLSGLAPSLLQPGTGIPVVVAMQDEISVGAAGAFTERFYRSFTPGGYVDTAVAEARRLVASSFSDEWGIPVLYLQNRSARLFDPPVTVSSRTLMNDLFAFQPVQRFVDRSTELADYTDLLFEDENPIVCWLWGPQKVGKKTLLDQLRFEANQRGYGHLMVADRSRDSHVGSGASILYELLRSMLEDDRLPQRLDQYQPARQDFADFWKQGTVNLPARQIVQRFLDGLDKFAGRLERGLVCLLYFWDFKAHANFLKGQDFEQLVYMVTDRYAVQKMQRVRFMIATSRPDDMVEEKLFPAVSFEYFFPYELDGLEGMDNLRKLCHQYGLFQDDQVPESVWRSVVEQALWSQSRRFLPGPPVTALARLAHWLDRGRPLDSLKVTWVSADGEGAGS